MPEAEPADLTTTAQSLHAGRVDATRLLQGSLERARSEAGRHVYLNLFEPSASAAADTADRLHNAGRAALPLAGLPVSVKALFDVAGEPTSAGAVVLDAPPAPADAACVARLRRAGAVLVGHTNMTEFAFSGVGLNPHHGTPVNAALAAIDPVPRIPGGSTSGGAVSVAIGAAQAALGSDTGGSIRIPAALCGLVGFKNTARLTPLDGTVPLSPTLDTACAITRSVRDAVLVHEVLADRPVRLRGRPLADCRLAIAADTMQEGLEPAVAAAFDAALNTLSAAGAQLSERPLPVAKLARLHALGSFAAAEAWQWHREHLARDEARYDPRVASRIRRGASMSAADLAELHRARRAWIDEMEAALREVDAVISPTVPLLAPAIEPLVASDERFFATNALLLRNPSVVNLLDGCAISLPCQVPGQAPVGLMLWTGALRDDALLELALAVEQALRARG